MRRVEKEYIRSFKRLGIYESYLEVREMLPMSILEQYEQVKEQDFFRKSGDKVQATINIFYGLSLNHSYGKFLSYAKKEKALSQPKA